MSDRSSPDLHPPAYLHAPTSPHQRPPPSDSSPSSLFLPPAAVASFLFAPTKPASPPLSRTPLQQLHNQALRLDAELHSLIDAQSLALLEPISPETAPTTATKSPLTLPATRSRILSAMRDLADVKSRQAEVYTTLAMERKDLLSSITTHTSKTQRLRQELAKIDASQIAHEVEQVRSSVVSGEQEIVAVRRRLEGLERDQRVLRARLDELENVLEAKSASYKAALSTGTQRTAAFLALHGQASPESAGEVWAREREAFLQRAGEAERERDALTEGVGLWGEAMERVRGFERRLKERIGGGGGAEEVAREIDGVVAELEEMVERARGEGWNLLVVAISNELQAYREAGEVLERSLRKREVLEAGVGRGGEPLD